MFFEYLYLIKYISIFFILGVFLFSISFFFVYQKSNNEKISSYECGFNIFSDARNKFEVRYYLIAILFIIFDFEILFLFPWSICLLNLNIIGILIMFNFLSILLLGFIYEWNEGALNL